MEKEKKISNIALSTLKLNPWTKAKDLTEIIYNEYQISVEKKELNLILYDLKKKQQLVQNSKYQWSLRDHSEVITITGKNSKLKKSRVIQEDPSNKESMSENPPLCPTHQIPMRERTAKRGKNAGNKFWGCPQWPNCNEIINFESDVLEQASTKKQEGSIPTPKIDKPLSSSKKKVPIVWTSHAGREDWIEEFTNIGSIPAFIKPFIDEKNEKLKQALSQTLILSKRSRKRFADEEQRAAASLLKKFLQRGRSPLPTLNIEKQSLIENNLGPFLEENPKNHPEIDFQISGRFDGNLKTSEIIDRFSQRDEFEIDNEYLLQRNKDLKLLGSDSEEMFFLEWVKNNLGITAAQWFIPQASLERLLETNGIDREGSRRVDFIFYHPKTDAIAIEIDGDEHESNEAVDLERDNSLRSIGIDVIRIRNDEVDFGSGPNLDKLRKRLEGVFSENSKLEGSSQDLAEAFIDCSLGSKIQYGVVKGIEYGWLEQNSDWEITIKGANDVAFSSVVDLIQLLQGLDQIYGTSITPESFDVVVGKNKKSYSFDGSEVKEGRTTPIIEEKSQIAIFIDIKNSNHQRIDPDIQKDFDVIIRPSFLPISLSVESSYFIGRRKIKLPREKANKCFEFYLQQFFRKKHFREHQSDAIYNALNLDDSVVLLPTGAGKSIIYQLASLLMPGITLVVDPLTALIEDQIEGLENYGIDRAIGLTSMNASREEKNRLLKGIERGEYHFILHSPERLQIPQFRSTLTALVETSLINLAVIDEAHCVSEWGHDFRPAYLNLSKNLKEFAKDPPILALTGTASRAVLRDILTELQIDRSNSNSLIRPQSFDRKEIKFEISKPERIDDAEAVLRGTLNSLPNAFGLPSNEFYRAAGKNTASGIVFVPFVNGRTHGVLKTLGEVKGSTKTNVTFYSGGAPKGVDTRNWEITKRVNVKDFKQNNAPILVSTKAFGMGIDKPNIRYTIHLGMPGSLEGFYQEAGRAGRDREQALARVIFTEYDQERSNTLLDPALDLEDLRSKYNEIASNRRTDDDITRALWFHLQNFSGRKNELEDVDALIKQLEPFSNSNTKELPFWTRDNGAKDQEKAIYRLVKIGIVKDYEKNWGSRNFTVFTNAFDLDFCKQTLEAYVHSAQPGRLKVFSEKLKELDETAPINYCINFLSRELIKFTYDVIERSRRRSIQESALLARNANKDKEIRKRLLNYLQEGLGAENFTELLEQTDVQLSDWREIVEKITNPIDAGEIRGLSIRSLESYPDHPGLLFVRGVSEMMCSDSDESTAEQILYTSFKSSSTSYDIEDEDMVETVRWMSDLASSRSNELSVPLFCAFYQAKLDNHFNEYEKSQCEEIFDEMQDEKITTIKQSFDTINYASKAEEKIKPILKELKDPEISKYLGV